MKKLLLALAIFAVLAAGIVFTGGDQPKSITTKRATPAPAGVTKSFNKNQFSTTDPSSIWVVVNKQHALSPKTYAPTDLVVPSVPLRVPGNESMQLRQAAASAVQTMFGAAKTDKLDLMLSSGYRSYAYQVSLYGGYVSSLGQAAADTQSARPSYSEHQSGLALDIEPTSRKCELEQCFADTPEGQWLVANAYKYGFILRYTPTEVATTGYESEPWHYRFIGVELASEMHSSNIATLEQFFRIPGGSTY
jgi:D-alanyl-D-alanine carboxypeptidase